MQNVIENAPLILRMVTAAGAILYSLSGIFHVFGASMYTVGVVGFYAFVLGLLSLVCEFSPLGLNKLLQLMPFLGEYRGRGILYAAMGLLTLGSEFGVMGQSGGFILLLSGIASLVMHYYGPDMSGSVAYSGDAAGPGTAFRRYDDGEQPGPGYGQF
eukprot:GDKI01041137.1.p1 GENE.GDKI01041137.1~~GDKI01041137.1.p1  ORF type:complete len:157 (-),score=38.24 GDKI01041137.1:166-636(-)